MNISAKNTSETPPLVRLAQVEVQWKLCNTFSSWKTTRCSTRAVTSWSSWSLLLNRLPAAIARLTRRWDHRRTHCRHRALSQHLFTTTMCKTSYHSAALHRQTSSQIADDGGSPQEGRLLWKICLKMLVAAMMETVVARLYQHERGEVSTVCGHMRVFQAHERLAVWGCKDDCSTSVGC